MSSGIPNPVLPQNDLYPAYVSHIVNPNEFFLQFKTFPPTPTLKRLQDQLSLHDAVLKNISRDDLPNSDIKELVGTFWAAKFSIDGKTYRAKVIDVAESEETLRDLEDPLIARVMVMFVDYGNTEEVVAEDLKKLPKDLTDIPAFATQCSLAYVREPVGGWTLKGLEEFQISTGFSNDPRDNMRNTAFIITKVFQIPVKVLLWQGLSSRASFSNRLINSFLVEEKYAETFSYDWVDKANELMTARVNLHRTSSQIVSVATTVLNSRKLKNNPMENRGLPIDQSFTDKHNGANKKTKTNKDSKAAESTDEILQRIDPMKYHAEIPENTLAVDEDSINMRIFGYQLNEPKNVCKRYFLEGYCKHGDNCYLKHISMNNANDLDKVEVLTEVCTDNLSIRKNYCFDAIVTCIVSPQSFWCVPCTPQNTDLGMVKLQDYQTLAVQMKKYFSLPENKENVWILPGLGSLVAYYLPNEGFGRGRVLEILDGDEDVYIQALDIGVCHVVPRANVYQLTREFALLPALAVHCTLTDTVPCKGYQWSRKAIHEFRRLALNRTCKILVKEIGTEERMHVQIFRMNKQGDVSRCLIEMGLACRGGESKSSI